MSSQNAAETFRSAFPDHESPKISYGLPFPEACRRHVEATFHASRVYIICSGSLARQTDALRDLQCALGDKVAGTRVGMKPHTLWSDVLDIVHDARDVKADLLVTLGGGSLTDGAKIIALALANAVSTRSDLASLTTSPPTPRPSPPTPPTIPIISIPTSLSGGEYANIAGGTDDATHEKRLFASPPTRGPRLVILSSSLSRTTPASIWLSTGIRAVDHCVETLCSRASNADADAAAEQGLKALVPGLLRSKHDPDDEGARHACQMGVVDAMRAVRAVVDLGASHGIGHQLGPLGVGHGETSCILLPAVCKFNARHDGRNVERQRKVLAIVWGEDDVRKVLDGRRLSRRDADLGDVLDAIIRELGMPRTLSDVGVGRDKLDALAENSLGDQWCKTNPVPLKSKEQVMEILEMVI